jgi:hypothetical protein
MIEAFEELTASRRVVELSVEYAVGLVDHVCAHIKQRAVNTCTQCSIGDRLATVMQRADCGAQNVHRSVSVEISDGRNISNTFKKLRGDGKSLVFHRIQHHSNTGTLFAK